MISGRPGAGDSRRFSRRSRVPPLCSNVGLSCHGGGCGCLCNGAPSGRRDEVWRGMYYNGAGAFPSLSLSLSLVGVAGSAGTSAAAGDDEGPCKAVLARLAAVAESRGYSLDPSASEFIGTVGGTEIQFGCSVGHLEIILRETSGSAVSVNFSRSSAEGFQLELVGEYPEVGMVSRVAILDSSADLLTGSLNFAADAGAGLVFVEVDLFGEVRAAGGDDPGDEARHVNAAFAPVLETSTIWKDAHVLGYAAAGIWDQRMAEHEPELDMFLGLAIPSPDPVAKVDADSKDAVQKCGVSFTICLAAAWLPPVGAWACGAALANCLAASPCLPGDCAGDGV